jgi:hypothetical protein
MTRNWIAMASRTLSMVRSGTARPRRHRSTPRLENLEGRLSMSGIVGNHIGVVAAIQGNHIGTMVVVERKH